MKDQINIKLKSYDVRSLDATAKKIAENIKKNGGIVLGPIPLPVKKTKYTLKRATHKFGYSQEAFEKRVHFRLIQIKQASSEIIDSLQKMTTSTGVEILVKL